MELGCVLDGGKGSAGWQNACYLEIIKLFQKKWKDFLLWY